jgi:hypothetical protein
MRGRKVGTVASLYSAKVMGVSHPRRSRSASGGGCLIPSILRRGDNGMALIQREEREVTQLIISKYRRERRAQQRLE